MAMTTEPEQLPCGVELEALVIQVTDDDQQPIDLAHQTSCPYCQTALRSLRQGWAEVQTLTREPVPIPPRLSAQIMARVRALTRHVTGSILLPHPPPPRHRLDRARPLPRRNAHQPRRHQPRDPARRLGRARRRVRLRQTEP